MKIVPELYSRQSVLAIRKSISGIRGKSFELVKTLAMKSRFENVVFDSLQNPNALLDIVT